MHSKKERDSLKARQRLSFRMKLRHTRRQLIALLVRYCLKQLKSLAPTFGLELKQELLRPVSQLKRRESTLLGIGTQLLKKKSIASQQAKSTLRLLRRVSTPSQLRSSLSSTAQRRQVRTIHLLPKTLQVSPTSKERTSTNLLLFQKTSVLHSRLQAQSRRMSLMMRSRNLRNQSMTSV